MEKTGTSPLAAARATPHEAFHPRSKFSPAGSPPGRPEGMLAGMNTNHNSTDPALVQHYSALLGLGEEWTVTRLHLNVEGRRLDLFLDYAAKAAVCPACGTLARLHDRQPERTWRHLDTMQFATYIHAPVPRVACPEHGAKVIELPWAGKHSRFTLLFEAFAVQVLQAARSKRHASELLRLEWHQTQEIMDAAVERGMQRRKPEEISYVGMDEKAFLKGKKADDFACLMVDLDESRVLEVSRGRSAEGAAALIDKALTPEQQQMVCAVAIDMSAPFEKAIREKFENADTVFDKFHVEKHLNEAVDRTRRQEHARLLKAKDRRLANTKYLWLKGTEHLSPEAEAERQDLLHSALETGKAWGLKEAFKHFWRSRDKEFARATFDCWYKEALRLGIRPMVKVAQMLKKHLHGLLAWFDSRIDNGRTEGYNSLVASILSAARGYRNFDNLRTAILFHCGKLDMMPDLVRVGGALDLSAPSLTDWFH